MTRWTAVALVLLAAWAVATFAFAPAPGWVHLLLTAGVFLLVYGAVVRGTAGGRAGAAPHAADPTAPSAPPRAR